MPTIDIQNENRFVSATFLQNLSDEISLRYGLKNLRLSRAINPSLVQEAKRPSILLQHIDYAVRRQILREARTNVNLRRRLSNYIDDSKSQDRPHINLSNNELTNELEMLLLRELVR